MLGNWSSSLSILMGVGAIGAFGGRRGRVCWFDELALTALLMSLVSELLIYVSVALGPPVGAVQHWRCLVSHVLILLPAHSIPIMLLSIDECFEEDMSRPSWTIRTSRSKAALQMLEKISTMIELPSTMTLHAVWHTAEDLAAAHDWIAVLVDVKMRRIVWRLRHTDVCAVSGLEVSSLM